MHPFLFGYDFYYLWSVGALLHHGVDPYDIDLLRQQLYALGWPTTEIPQRFTHPPNTLWLYWLLAIAPFKVSLLIWSCVSYALIFASTLILARAVGVQSSLSRYFILAAAAIFPPSLGTIIWGQVNAALLLGLALFALGWVRGRFFYAGMGLSLVLIKPHIFVPLLVVILVWEILSRRSSCIAGCACGFLFQIAASCTVSPDCIVWYRGALDGIVDESMLICGATLGQFIECNSGLRSIRPLLLALGCLAALQITKVRGYTLVTLLAVVLPLSMSVSPYCWMHSLVVLIPGLLCIGSYFSSRLSERSMMYSMVVASAATLPLIVQGGWQPVWIVLSWGVFLAALCTTQGSESPNLALST
jgi:hypothetical protein